MKLEEVFAIVRQKRLAVVSTVEDSGAPEAALVIGWDNDISIQIEGAARRPQGDDLAYAKAAYYREWPDGRARENWPDIAYIVVKPRWMRYANYAGAPVIEEFTL